MSTAFARVGRSADVLCQCVRLTTAPGMQVEHVLDASYGDVSISEAQTLSIEVLCKWLPKGSDRFASCQQPLHIAAH